MSSKLEDKFHEDIEEIIDNVKKELRYVMHINNDPEKMVRFLGVSFRLATKEVEKIKKEENSSFRKAAYVLAVKTILQAEEDRGNVIRKSNNNKG